MSRGHGAIERSILESLFDARLVGRDIGTETLAANFTGSHNLITPSVSSSLRRALRRMYWADKVNCYSEDGALRWHINKLYFIAAIHEAGHAVIARALNVQIKYATVRPKGDSDGHVRPLTMPKTRADFKKDVLWTLAGRAAVSRAAEQKLAVINRRGEHGAHHDNANARRAIREIVGDRTGDLLVTWKPDVTAYRNKAAKEAERLVRLHWDSILQVARRLAADGTLTGEEIDAVIKATKRARKKAA